MRLFSIDLGGLNVHTGFGSLYMVMRRLYHRFCCADADPATKLVLSSLRAKEKAHEGPVTALAAAAGRLWSAGGSSAFVCLREWTQRGEFVARTDLKQLGRMPLGCFVLTSRVSFYYMVK